MADCCLRPEFTHELVESLLHGKSINLIGAHGQGRRRTLRDLCEVFPKSWRVFQVDMRIVEKEMSSLLNELLKQEKIENIASIHDFLHKLNENSVNYLIIIHNYHLLTDLNVISYLNTIGNYPYLSLLCVSEKKQESPALLATDCILPMVTSKQLLAEIKRRDLKLKQEDMQLLTDFLLQQVSPYSFLDTKPLSWFVNTMWKMKNQREGYSNV